MCLELPSSKQGSGCNQVSWLSLSGFFLMSPEKYVLSSWVFLAPELREHKEIK